MTLLRSRPLRAKSDKAKARDVRLAKVKRELLIRARYRCELCGTQDDRLDLHHVFGRHGLGPWNDSLECVACLCRKCHEYVTNNPAGEGQERLEREALERLTFRFPSHPGLAPVGVIGLTKGLEAEGIEP